MVAADQRGCDLSDKPRRRQLQGELSQARCSHAPSDPPTFTIPGASHFVQQDAPEMVSDTMLDWLKRRKN